MADNQQPEAKKENTDKDSIISDSSSNEDDARIVSQMAWESIIDSSVLMLHERRTNSSDPTTLEGCSYYTDNWNVGINTDEDREQFSDLESKIIFSDYQTIQSNFFPFESQNTSECTNKNKQISNAKQPSENKPNNNKTSFRITKVPRNSAASIGSDSTPENLNSSPVIPFNSTPPTSRTDITTPDSSISKDDIPNTNGNTDNLSNTLPTGNLLPIAEVSLNIPLTLSRKTVEREIEYYNLLLNCVPIPISSTIQKQESEDINVKFQYNESNKTSETSPPENTTAIISKNSLENLLPSTSVVVLPKKKIEEITSNTPTEDETDSTISTIEDNIQFNNINSSGTSPVIFPQTEFEEVMLSVEVSHTDTIDTRDLINSPPISITNIYQCINEHHDNLDINPNIYNDSVIFPLNEVGEVTLNLTPITITNNTIQRGELDTTSRIYEYEITTAMYSTPNFRVMEDSETFTVDQSGFRSFNSVDAIQKDTQKSFRK